MTKTNLTDDEKRKLVEETNKMIEEYNELSMDIIGYSQLVTRIGLFQKIFDTENKEYYKVLEKRFRIKRDRLLFLNKQIKKNKETLGIKKVKKKNKTL